MDRYSYSLCGPVISRDGKSSSSSVVGKALFKKLYEPQIKEAEKKCEKQKEAKKKQTEAKKAADKETVPEKKRKYWNLPEYI